MNIANTINDIRARISDNDGIEYTDKEIVGYINDALFAVWLQLKAIRCKDVINSIDITAVSQAKPLDFFDFTNRQPVVSYGDNFEVYGDLPILKATYFTKSPHINVGDTIVSVFDDNYDSAVVQIACLYALNRNEFNIQQDQSLVAQVKGLIGV